MRKTLSIALVLMLIAALATPAVAFAAKGGKGAEQAAAARGAKGGTADRGQAPGQAKKQLKAQKREMAPEASEAASNTPDGDESTEGTITMSPGKQKGITNAFTRVHANLVRMQERVEAGLRKQLPPGLLRVFEKLFSWLGDSAPELETPWISPESTSTVEPTGTVEPTETIVATGTAG